MTQRNRGERQRGMALLLVVLLGFTLMMLSILSLGSTLRHRVAQDVQRESFWAGQIAESAAAQALARLKDGGVELPVSGGGISPQWVTFGGGEFYYYTTFDVTTEVSRIRAWGRVAVDPSPSTSTAAPDSASWDGTGWMVEGVEITVKSSPYIPDSPLFFGNGAVERPQGGFENSAGADPADPSTWTTVTSSPSSYQSASIPFESSALDHPADFLYNGGTPAPASTNPHPYRVWASQNPLGQFNIEAWFANSAGSGNDPTINVTPPPTASYYDTSDSTSPDYPYPVEPDIPDVQNFATALWTRYRSDPGATLLGTGSHSGTHGDLTNPVVTIVTGELRVDAGTTFRGAGVLLVRDDYDPNVDTENTPATKARLTVAGTLEWTGLVVVAGWAPTIEVQIGGSASIVGALFGEDSVQSGSEVSLDSATIVLIVEDRLRVLFSNGLFQLGGPIHPFLPRVEKEVVGIREI